MLSRLKTRSKPANVERTMWRISSVLMIVFAMGPAIAHAEEKADYLSVAAQAVECLEQINAKLGEVVDAGAADRLAPDITGLAKRYASAMMRLKALDPPVSPDQMVSYVELSRRMQTAVIGYQESVGRLRGSERTSAALDAALMNLKRRQRE